jgi:hydroxypyruvate isomerase
MDEIKQSAADWCYYRESMQPAAYYRRLKKLGYLGAEMVPAERWQAVKDAGLKLVNLAAPGMQEGLNRKGNHAKLLPAIRTLIQTARENEVEHIIFFSGNRLGQADEDGLKNVIAAGKALAADAEKAGVVLALELLNSYDHLDYQADHPSYAFEFAHAVSSPAVKVLYDIYHMQRMNADLQKDILENLEYIAHLHVAGSPKRDFPGAAQEIDYSRLVSEVHRAGYGGFWGQEFVPAGDPMDELGKARVLFDSYAHLAPGTL